ncbi:hypothetical protein EWF20_04500 [Sulfolobus sp. S-194]|uniref:hypothetical protein n=1 Tax=Sulfolobus sp. S-194 TaxID=2512240 RepID=UPI001437136A|nr:hypothetical protein [Sulfolobus sp. S-194]QIW23487.1 hypothetical protein EWF20_04500 [Sulfolobus sp. S-194]
MIVKINVNQSEKVLDITNTKKIIISEKGENKYYTVRLLYYLMKSIYNIPRLYGYLKGDPIESWRQNFEKYFLQLLKSDLEISSTYFKGDFEIDQPSINISGKIDNLNISVKIILKEKPTNISLGIQGNFQVDSFYFSKIERIKPYIIPSSRAGLLYAFSKFLVYQYEGAPGIPKAFGIAAEFINSMLLPQGFTDEINNHKIWVNQENNYVYFDDSILYNATSDLLSLLSLKLFLTRGTEKELLIIEDPEAHLDEEEKELVKKWINETKSKVIIVSNEKDW